MVQGIVKSPLGCLLMGTLRSGWQADQKNVIGLYPSVICNLRYDYDRGTRYECPGQVQLTFHLLCCAKIILKVAT